jgi:CheY-like chemotaxis protein
MTDEERQTLEAGQIRFLRKPIDLAELKQLLAELLAGRPVGTDRARTEPA